MSTRARTDPDTRPKLEGWWWRLLHRDLIGQRDQAIRDAASFGFEFHHSFTHLLVEGDHAYANTNHGADYFAERCRREVEAVIRTQLGQRAAVWADTPDVIVKVWLNGNGIEGGPYLGSPGRHGMVVAGASIGGSVYLCPKGLPPLHTIFVGVVMPPKGMLESHAAAGPPFLEALAKSTLKSHLNRALTKIGYQTTTPHP